MAQKEGQEVQLLVGLAARRLMASERQNNLVVLAELTPGALRLLVVVAREARTATGKPAEPLETRTVAVVAVVEAAEARTAGPAAQQMAVLVATTQVVPGVVLAV